MSTSSFLPPIAVTSPSFSRHPELRAELEKIFPEVKFNSDGARLGGDDLKFFLKGARGVIIGTETLGREILQALPELQVIAKYGVGTDNLDLSAIQELGKTALLFPGTNKNSVAELTLGLMLSWARHLHLHFQEMARAQWQKRSGVELSGKKVGIIGVGHIGKRLIELLAPFKVQILANDLLDGDSLQKEFYQRHQVSALSKEEIYRQSDIITLHLPLNSQTEALINAHAFAQMRPETLLINTARGRLIDFSAMKEALKKNQIKAIACDVFDEEPFIDQELLNDPRFLATPHIGGSTENAIWTMGESAIHGLAQFFSRELEVRP